MHIVTIDPGLNCGVAIWTPDGTPDRTHLVRAGKESSWTRRVLQQIAAVKSVWPEGSLLTVIEWPFNARANDESVMKLSFLIGGIASEAGNVGSVYLVPVRQWKGTLPKNVVIDRLRKKHGYKADEFRADEWDAVGIGHWLFNAARVQSVSPRRILETVREQTGL